MLVLFYIYIYINSTNIPPFMIINRIYENQNLLSLWLLSFLVGLRIYQHPCRSEWRISCVLWYCAALKSVVMSLFPVQACVIVVCVAFSNHSYLIATWHNSPYRAKTSLFFRIHDHIQMHAHSKGLLWTGDQPDLETSSWQHTTLTTDIRDIGEIRNRNSSKWGTAGLRLRLRGRWARRSVCYVY